MVVRGGLGRRVWPFLVVCASAGCGAVNAPDDAAESTEALMCRATGWREDGAVAAAFVGNDVVLVHGDGSRQPVHTFPAVDASAKIRFGARGITAAGATESVYFRDTGEVEWRLDGSAQGASDAGMGAIVDGVPKLVRADGTTSDVPVDHDLFEFTSDPDEDGWLRATWTHGTFSYHGRVNLDGVRFNEQAPQPGTPSRDPGKSWGFEGEPGSLPTAMVNNVTRERVPLQLAPLAPLRLLDDECSARPVVHPDGRLGMGLRDDASAGFYLGHPDGTGWERVGAALRDVTTVDAGRVSETWVLRATSFMSYCSQDEPAQPFAPAPGVSGDSLQFVYPGQEPYVFDDADYWTPTYATLDKTGSCAYVRGDESAPAPRFLDLSTGLVHETPELASFTWL